MGLSSCLGRIVIIVLNIMFLLTSIGLLIAGLMARYASKVLDVFIAAGEKELNELISTQLGGTTNLKIDLTDVLVSLAVALIMMGMVLGALSLLGCCGACYEYKILLLVYAVILIIILIVQAIVVGLFLGSPDIIKDPIRDQLKTGIKEEYQGLEGTNTITLAWNVFMLQFECCGVDNYKDFTNAVKWKKSPTSTNAASFIPFGMPIACCSKITSLGCTAVDSDDNFKDKGCLDTLWNMFIGDELLMYGTFAAALVFEILLIVFTLAIYLKDDTKISPIG